MSMIEFVAAFFGVLGTLLLATKGRFAGWGFVAFLASNAGWLYFSFANGHQWMFAQQVAFTASSLVGIYVWLLRAPRETGDRPRWQRRRYWGGGWQKWRDCTEADALRVMDLRSWEVRVDGETFIPLRTLGMKRK